MSDIMDPATTPGGDGPVIRALRVLSHIANEGRPVTIRELTQNLGLPASTVHRLLQLLRSEGFIARSTDSAEYRVGGGLFELASAVLDHGDLAALAQPVLDELSEQVEEMCLLAVRVTGTTDYTFLARSAPRGELGPDIPLDLPFPIAWGASGTAILANLSEEERDRAMTRAASCPTDGAPLDRAALEATCERIRSQGYSVFHGIRVPGAIGIAAPVRSGTGRVIGSLCIAIPEARFFPIQEHLTGTLAARFADRFSRYLGSDRSAPPDGTLQEVV